jgi:hypothetical protein
LLAPQLRGSGARLRQGHPLVGTLAFRIRPPLAVPLTAMRLQGIRAGDLVLCDVKGRRFHAEVTTTPTGAELEVRPLLRGITYRRVSARSVKEHWRKAGRRASGGAPRAPSAEDTEVFDDVLFTLG